MNNLTKKAVIIITAVSMIFLAIGYFVGRNSSVSDNVFGTPASQLKDDREEFIKAMDRLIENTKPTGKGHKPDIKSVL